VGDRPRDVQEKGIAEQGNPRYSVRRADAPHWSRDFDRYLLFKITFGNRSLLRNGEI